VDTKGGLEGLTSALGINIKTLAGWGTAIAAGKMALDVAKDAFFNNEEQLDEWGRVVESSQSLYTGFLNALNTGGISGYLNNISQIVKAARDAYDALDSLGTYNAFNQINVERTRTNMTESIADYRGGKGTKDAVKAAGEAYKKELQDRKRLENEAYLAAVKRVAAERGVSAKDLTDALSGTYGHYQDLKNVQPTGVRQTVVGAGMFARTGTETFAQTRQEKLGEALRHLNDTELQNLQALGAQAQRTGNEIAQVDKQLTRVLNGKQPGATGGKGGKTGKTNIQYADDSIMAQEKQVQELTQKWKTASGELRDGYLKDLEEAQKKLAEMTGKAKGDGAPTFTMAQLEGISFDNQIPTTRGNNGRAQDKLDLATAAFATGGTSDIDFSNYISGIKNALSNANLGDELYTSMTEKLKDATTVSTLLQEMMERGLAGADLESTAQALKEKLLSPEGIDQTAIQSFLEELNKQIEEAGGVGLKLNADTGEVTDDKGKDKDDGKELEKFNEGIGKLSGGLSQVTGGLKAVGVEIPEEVDQVIGVINGVSQIISGVGTIISIFSTSALTANTTAVGLNTAAIAGLIASIEVNTATNFIPFLANGGIVPAFAHGGLIGRAAAGLMIPGNSMSGDRLRLPVDGGRGMIGVNSGELILNKSSQNSLAASLLNAEALVDSIRDYRVSLGNAQQAMIAGALEGGGSGNLHLETVISGEDIRVVLKNNGRRTGRGEYITSRNSRS
jgi:hypothetical protein